MIDFVYAYKTRSKLKHVVTEGNDDELGILCALFNVGGYDRDLLLLVKYKWNQTIQKKESEVDKMRGENLRF